MHKNKKAKTSDIAFGILSILLSLIAAPMLTLFGVIWASLGQSVALGVNAAALGLLLAGTWIFAGVKAMLRVEKSARYSKIIGAHPRFKISDVAQVSGKSLKSVSADLKMLRKRGYFEGMSFDTENKEVVFSSKSPPLLQLNEEADIVYKENKSPPVTAIILSLLTAASFSLFELMLLVPALVIGVGVFFLSLHFFPSQVYFTEERRKTPKMKKPSSTGNEELDNLLASVYESKKEMLRLSAVIKTPKIREPLGEIMKTVDEIVSYVIENPAKVRSLRQFVGYYLPTTVNFLKTYEELQEKPNKGENILTTLHKIEETTGKLTDVYKREYDDLFSDKAMDISAEAAVMQAIIKENNNII
ncbi:MAG: 5-bromo-4-chloroindolyl phosphate hydrolysis family protein [Oscillospiraceae bacterium]|nr:5-bromo-4-chloroindolyl phosphate hydrolysis family protein [Oscillospiraceae bacterium]